MRQCGACASLPCLCLTCELQQQPLMNGAIEHLNCTQNIIQTELSLSRDRLHTTTLLTELLSELLTSVCRHP